MKTQHEQRTLFCGRRGGALIKQTDGKDDDLRRQVGMFNPVQQEADAVGRNALPFGKNAGKLRKIRNIEIWRIRNE